MQLQTVQRATQYLGLAKDAAQLKMSNRDQVRQQARSHIVRQMGRMHGLPQKLGQMIGFSERSDGTAASEFDTLQDSTEPLPLTKVLPILDLEWGRPHSEVLYEISPDANAASLGQVHRAKLRDGREVAVKVQYPDIHDAVMLDLKMLGWLSLPVGNLRRGFDLAGYRNVFLNDLENELDYRQEAQAQSRCAAWTSQSSVLVPEVVSELSTGRVLVSAWEEGERWADVHKKWNDRDRRQLAKAMLQFFHRALFDHSEIHADWHPGNFRFRKNAAGPQIVVYDFGCVFRPGEETRLALLRLIRATLRQDESPYPIFLKLGFDHDFLAPLAAKLPALCRVLLEPYWAEYPYDANDWRLSERVSDVLGDDRWNLRIAGPPDLIFLLRAFFGLKYYLSGLNTQVSWSQMISDILSTYQRQVDELELAKENVGCADFSTLADYLRIRVDEGGIPKVQLSQRASAIDNLDELIDDDLKHKIEQKTGPLRKVISNVRERGYSPGLVFEHVDGKKEIRVWLE